MIERDVETRSITLAPELRSSGNRVGGYAAAFGIKSEPLPMPPGLYVMGGQRSLFVETVNNRAFAKGKNDGFPSVVSLWEHRQDPQFLLGTVKAGSMGVDIDDYGLSYWVDLLPSRYDLRDLVARGDISGSSFSFEAMEDDWQADGDGFPLRTLLSCRLIECGPCANPAYPNGATVGLRSLARFVGAPYEDVEARAATGDIRGLLATTKPKPGRPPLFGQAAKARLDEMRNKTVEQTVTDEPTEEEKANLDIVKVSAVTASDDRPKTIQGRQALMETLAAKPNGPDRLLETLAAQQFSGAERLAQTTVAGQIAALQAELAEIRSEIARLSDPNLIELEEARERIARAEELAQLDLRQMSGQPLSGKDALKLMGVAPSTTQPEARSDDARSDFADPGWQKDGQPRYPLDTPERVTLAWDYINNAHDGSLYTAEQLAEIKAKIKDAAKRFDIELDDNLDNNNRSYRRWVPTMNPHEALRQLEAMRLPDSPRPAFRACDAYAAESGGRF
jgi:HK97 family phage prohead protease